MAIMIYYSWRWIFRKEPVTIIAQRKVDTLFSFSSYYDKTQCLLFVLIKSDIDSAINKSHLLDLIASVSNSDDVVGAYVWLCACPSDEVKVY